MPPPKPIPPGTKFGKLTVIRYAPEIKGRGCMHIVQCECGRLREYLGTELRQWIRTSCGRGCQVKKQRRLAYLKAQPQFPTGKKKPHA